MVNKCNSIILCKWRVYLKTLLKAGMCGFLFLPYWLLNYSPTASETSLVLLTWLAIHWKGENVTLFTCWICSSSRALISDISGRREVHTSWITPNYWNRLIWDDQTGACHIYLSLIGPCKGHRLRAPHLHLLLPALVLFQLVTENHKALAPGGCPHLQSLTITSFIILQTKMNIAGGNCMKSPRLLSKLSIMYFWNQLLSNSFYRWGAQGPERHSNFLKLTQIFRGRARRGTWGLFLGCRLLHFSKALLVVCKRFSSREKWTGISHQKDALMGRGGLSFNPGSAPILGKLRSLLKPWPFPVN